MGNKCLHASVSVFVGERGTLRIVNAFPRNVSTVPHLKMIASTTLLEGHVACGLRRRVSPRRTSKDSEAQMEVTCTNILQKHMLNTNLYLKEVPFLPSCAPTF